jgi:hypothetical protein
MLANEIVMGPCGRSFTSYTRQGTTLDVWIKCHPSSFKMHICKHTCAAALSLNPSAHLPPLSVAIRANLVSLKNPGLMRSQVLCGPSPGCVVMGDPRLAQQLIEFRSGSGCSQCLPGMLAGCLILPGVGASRPPPRGRPN